MLSTFTDQQGTPPTISDALHSLAAGILGKKGVPSVPTRMAITANPMSPWSSCSSGCRIPSDYYTHPAAADAALHLGAVPVGPAKGPSRVPVALEGLLANPGESFGASGAPGWAAAAVPAAAANVPVLTSNALWHCERSGQMTVSGLAAKLLPGQVSSPLLLCDSANVADSDPQKLSSNVLLLGVLLLFMLITGSCMLQAEVSPSILYTRTE